MDDMSRFQYAVLASVVLHAAVMFGISIRPPDLSKLNFVAPPLEVVLVNAKTASRPLQADALAQRNLDGGGNTDAARRAKSPLPVTRRDRQTSEPALESQRLQQLEREAQKLLTQVKSQATVESAATQPQPQTETRVAAPNVADIMNKSIQIARLEAQIDKDMDSYQKRPRRRFVGARTQEYRFARYIEDWRIKVERVGTLNYPQAARDQKIYGSLQLTVSINADGTVENVEINRSSGQKILDAAALRIVRLGAPYSAFPANISRDTDVLSITRTWTFTRSDRFSPE
ncbi:MAG: energy transducer TonB [Betaproteobacteria bacterium]|nr:energy transducer TonB [Betaproteobacteria bacterium]MBI3054555.1 energy transducer TonB [Betaproteobacteria bacterium]